MVTTSERPEEQSKELTAESSGAEKWWALLGIGISTFIFGLEVHIVNLALPILVEALDTNFATIQWVVLSYVLMLTVFVLGVARLGDMYNKKWLYLGGLVLFTISSVLCGVAPTVGFLIGFRALQGLGAVFMSALGAAIITQVFPSEERGRALGILNGIFALGLAIGPGVGGLLIGLGGWRLIFLVNLPIGLIASLIVVLVVPSCVSSETKQGFDWIGALLMTATLTCFALAMTLVQTEGFGLLTAPSMLAIAVIGLACFVVVESRLSEPMIDLGMFRDLQLSLSLLLSWVVFFVVAAVNLLLPLFLELVKHYPLQEVGLLLTVLPMASALASPIAGTLSDRFGERIITLIGLLLMIGGCWAISTLDTDSTALGFIVRAVPIQMGIGTFFCANSSAVMGAVPQERLGIASGLLSLSRTLGLTTGVPLVGALFSTLTLASAKLAPDIDVTQASVEALVVGVDATFRLTAAIAIACTILGVVLWWVEHSQAQNQSEPVG
ncbi:EmrB/QacA subfamily drug resistance transporter [Kalymmatonema gypsitolerans NIES-4073]|nr:EmrB/QacA subfamily drug resistance transporter [Scytonema sp. NIES-4073]